jgi:hypothetical protein
LLILVTFQVHLRMQSFDAAEQDCCSALKIDKRMTKALFRCCPLSKHARNQRDECNCFD